MNTRAFFKSTILLLFFTILFNNCSDDVSSGSPEVKTPPTTNVPAPNGRVPRIAPTICNYDLNEASLTSAGWTKIFEDNFTTDLSKWNVWTGGAFNNELQHYQASNIQLVNGVLVITAKKETVTGATNPWDATPKTFQYTSGRIECRSNVSANPSTPKVRMMARIKLVPGYGMWPAFWSYGDPWPTQGEIDFVEAKGQNPTQYSTNYFYGTQPNQNLVTRASKVITADSDLTQCYHVFEMIWEQNQLTSILDGTVVEVKTSGGYIPSLFGKTERITLNLAVGGNFFGAAFDPSKIQTGSLYVDWVKVFTSN
ncbi:MAG TPA: glycoside hydrolase family 16 protein [Chryseosolibacter sp.]|nr:glycoside hydrolase family 16 protein [Chryseosolibacter sp.]